MGSQMTPVDLFLCCLGGCSNFKLTFEMLYWRVIGRAVCPRHPLAISHSAQGHLLLPLLMPITQVMEQGGRCLVLLCVILNPKHDFALPLGRRLFTENSIRDAQKW